MEKDILNFSPIGMFRGTPVDILRYFFCILMCNKQKCDLESCNDAFTCMNKSHFVKVKIIIENIINKINIKKRRI